MFVGSVLVISAFWRIVWNASEPKAHEERLLTLYSARLCCLVMISVVGFLRLVGFGGFLGEDECALLLISINACYISYSSQFFGKCIINSG